MISTEAAEDRRELPRDIADRAIARYVEAVRERAEAYRLASGHDEYEPWTDLTTLAAIEAERMLILAILTCDADYCGPRSYKADRRRWEPRGIRSQGRLYITAPNPDRDEGRDGIPENLDGPMLMQLVVVEESRIVDVERAGYLEPGNRGEHR